MSGAIRETSSVLFKTNPSAQSGGETFEEFAHLCGVNNKRIWTNHNVEISGFMQSLNGAALSGAWLMFEYIDKLSLTNLQTLTREIQMVQQQFLIAENSLERPNGDARSVFITAHSNENMLKKGPKSLQALFVVMVSVTPELLETSNLLTNLKCSFRVYNLNRPPIQYIASVLLMREGYRNHVVLAKSLNDLAKLITSRTQVPVGVTCNDIMMIIAISKKLSEQECESGEIQLLVKASKLYLFSKLQSTVLPQTCSSREIDELGNSLDDWIYSSFKRRPREQVESVELRKALEKATDELKYVISPYQLAQAEELYYALAMNRGVVLLGPKMSGKSTVVQILSKALSVNCSMTCDPVYIDPNTFTMEELFGNLDTSKEKQLGILYALLEKMNRKYRETLYK